MRWWRQKDCRKVAANLVVLLAILLVAAIYIRPSPVPELARYRMERKWETAFSLVTACVRPENEIVKLEESRPMSLDNEREDICWLGRVGEEYAALVVEKQGLFRWKGDCFVSLEPSEDLPVIFMSGSGSNAAGLFDVRQTGGNYVFGLVQDPSIVRVEFTGMIYDIVTGSRYERICTYQTETTDFYDGMFYMDVSIKYLTSQYIFSAYDEAGELVYQFRYCDDDGDSSVEQTTYTRP